jgi:tetratricopeptide (TPR) repeat protein
MFKFYGIGILAAFLFFSCSSKEGLVLEEETPESLLGKAQAAYDNQNYEESMHLAQVLLDNFPTTDLHVNAQLLMAKSLGGKEKFEDQLDLLLRILKENIIPEKVPLIYTQIAEFYEGAAVWNPGNVTNDTTDYIKAARYYRKAVFYPNSNDNATKAKALYRTGLMYAKANDLVKAKQAYGQVIDSFAESPYASLARTKLLDPTNTEELIPQPILTPETAVAGGETDVESGSARSAVSGSISDSLGLELPSTEDEEPVIIDTTQAELPDNLE